MKILSFGDLIPAGEFILHSQFEKAANFEKNARIVSLVSPEIGEGPFNIVIDRLPPRGIKKISVSEKIIAFGKAEFRKSGIKKFDSAFPKIGISEGIFRTRLRFLKKKLLVKAHPLSCAFIFNPAREANFRNSFEKSFLSCFKEGIARLKSGDFPLFVSFVKGRGFGLTPSGDDFLAGFLSFISFSELNFGTKNRTFSSVLERVCRSANPVADSAYVAAKKGHCDKKLKVLLNALAKPHYKSESEDKLADYLEKGSTSGADFISGFFAAGEFV